MPVTFRRKVLDKYVPEIRLLTYETEELRTLLETVVSETADANDLPGTLGQLERRLDSQEG